MGPIGAKWNHPAISVARGLAQSQREGDGWRERVLIRITVSQVDEKTGQPIVDLETFDWPVKKWKGIFWWARKYKREYMKQYSDGK